LSSSIKTPRQAPKKATGSRSSRLAAPPDRSSSGLDPRLARRRREVKKSEAKKRLRTVIALAVITIGSISALAVLQSTWMDIDTINVVGAVQTNPDSVVTASNIIIGEPLVDLDPALAIEGVRTLPWVAEVAIEREWNGAITVSITERVPALALATEGGFMLIDATGRQLERVAEQPPEFMPIAGLAASGVPGQPAPPQAHGVVRLLGLLTPERQQAIAQVVVDERTLYLDLVGQGRVRLGNDSGLSEKLVSLDTILSAVDLRCLWEIDVRVHTAPAVTRLRTDGVPRAPLTDLSTCT